MEVDVLSLQKHLSNRKHSMVEKVVTKAGKDCRVCSNKYREPGLAILAYGKLKLKKGNFRKFNECKKNLALWKSVISCVSALRCCHSMRPCKLEARFESEWPPSSAVQGSMALITSDSTEGAALHKCWTWISECCASIPQVERTKFCLDGQEQLAGFDDKPFCIFYSWKCISSLRNGGMVRNGGMAQFLSLRKL